MMRNGHWKTMAKVAAAGIAATLLVRRANGLPLGERATSTTPRAPCGGQASGGRCRAGGAASVLIRLSRLKDGVDAFAARLLLVRAAEVRLDLQY